MHQNISEVTILTIIISTILLIVLGGVIIYFLYAYQKKVLIHKSELFLLNEKFSKTLLESKLEIQEQTLHHIAKELHANISHLTSVININLGVYLEQFPLDANENIRETKVLVKQLMSEVKSLSLTLNTEHIGKAGFLKMLEKELERLNKTGRYAMKFNKEGESFRLREEKEIILFRLCQEILNNIIKHADSTEIFVHVLYVDSAIHLTIEDNGKGFDLESVRADATLNNSTGLANIYNRSKQINGEVVIKSEVQKGTTIKVKIPY